MLRFFFTLAAMVGAITMDRETKREIDGAKITMDRETNDGAIDHGIHGGRWRDRAITAFMEEKNQDHHATVETSQVHEERVSGESTFGDG